MKEQIIKWAKAAGVRALKTFGQSLGSMLTVGAAMQQIDWAYVLSSSVVALVYSLATSLAGLPELKGGENDA